MPLSVSKERVATQEPTNFSTRSEDPADRHGPENRNFFRYLQRPRRIPTAKCLLRVSSSKDWYGRYFGTAIFGDVEASHFTGCRGSRVSFNYFSIFGTFLADQSSFQSSRGAQDLVLEQATVRRTGGIHCCASHNGYRLQDRSSSRMAPCHGRRICSTCRWVAWSS